MERYLTVSFVLINVKWVSILFSLLVNNTSYLLKQKSTIVFLYNKDTVCILSLNTIATIMPQLNNTKLLSVLTSLL